MTSVIKKNNSDEILFDNFGNITEKKWEFISDQVMGGIAALNDNLSHDLSRKLGSYEQSNVYHVEVLDGEIWFAITDYQGLNEVKVISFDGVETASYQAGISPGDFAKWTD